jgi:biotin operon repressor
MSNEQQSETVTAQIRRFFLDNPDEELSTADLMEKFGITRQQVNDTRKELKRKGLIETVTVTRAMVSKTRRREV